MYTWGVTLAHTMWVRPPWAAAFSLLAGPSLPRGRAVTILPPLPCICELKWFTVGNLMLSHFQIPQEMFYCGWATWGVVPKPLLFCFVCVFRLISLMEGVPSAQHPDPPCPIVLHRWDYIGQVMSVGVHLLTIEAKLFNLGLDFISIWESLICFFAKSNSCGSFSHLHTKYLELCHEVDHQVLGHLSWTLLFWLLSLVG